MAREYAPDVVSTREYAPEPAAAPFTPDEDTQYSPEGVPLITPSTQAAPTGAGKTAANLMTDVVSAPVRAGLATAKPFADIAKWMGMKEPINALTQTDVGIKQASDWAPGIQGPLGSIASFGGDIAGLKGLGKGIVTGAEKLGPSVAPYVEKAGEWLAKHPFTGQSIGGGAAIGVLGASPTAGSAVDEALTGAVLGAATHGLFSGAGAIMSPALERFKQLKSMGLSTEQILKDTTIGQLLGGATQKIENVLGDLPFAGARNKIIGGIKSLNQALEEHKGGVEQDKDMLQGIANKALGTKGSLGELDVMGAKTKQQKLADLQAEHERVDADLAKHVADKKAELDASETEFHRPLIDRALSHLPSEYSLDPSLKGHEAISGAQDMISAAYKNALEGIGNLRLPKTAQDELRALADNYKGELGGEDSPLHSLLKNRIENLLGSTSKGNWLTPENWQGQLSSLSKEAYNAKAPNKALFENNYGKALSDIKDKWMDLIEGKAGSDLFKAANQAHSEFQIPQKAASYISSLKNEGEFNPNDLLRAIASETSTKRLAGGESELQKIAQEGYKNLTENRAAHKKYVEDITNHINNLKKSEVEQLKGSQNPTSDFNLIDKNVDLRKAALQGKVNALNAQKDAEHNMLKDAVKEITSSPGENYQEKRTLYNLMGTGALTGGAYGLAHFLGLPLAGALSGSAILGTRGLYSKPVQTALKKAAIAERPEAVKAAGEALKENAPLGALATVESVEQSKKKPGVGVQVIDPATGKQINRQGGLP